MAKDIQFDSLAVIRPLEVLDHELNMRTINVSVLFSTMFSCSMQVRRRQVDLIGSLFCPANTIKSAGGDAVNSIYLILMSAHGTSQVRRGVTGVSSE